MAHLRTLIPGNGYINWFSNCEAADVYISVSRWHFFHIFLEFLFWNICFLWILREILHHFLFLFFFFPDFLLPLQVFSIFSVNLPWKSRYRNNFSRTILGKPAHLDKANHARQVYWTTLYRPGSNPAQSTRKLSRLGLSFSHAPMEYINQIHLDWAYKNLLNNLTQSEADYIYI